MLTLLEYFQCCPTHNNGQGDKHVKFKPHKSAHIEKFNSTLPTPRAMSTSLQFLSFFKWSTFSRPTSSPMRPTVRISGAHQANREKLRNLKKRIFSKILRKLQNRISQSDFQFCDARYTVTPTQQKKVVNS